MAKCSKLSKSSSIEPLFSLQPLTPKPDTLGDSPDYHTKLFCTQQLRLLNDPVARFNCAPGTIRISEVDPHGHFIKLYNCMQGVDIDITDFSLIQTCKSKTMENRFIFPSRAVLKAGHAITVYSSFGESRLPKLDKSPGHLIAHSIDSWQGQIGCTTILCNSRGLGIAWFTKLAERKPSKLPLLAHAKKTVETNHELFRERKLVPGVASELETGYRFKDRGIKRIESCIANYQLVKAYKHRRSISANNKRTSK